MPLSLLWYFKLMVNWRKLQGKPQAGEPDVPNQIEVGKADKEALRPSRQLQTSPAISAHSFSVPIYLSA